jgi:hypothetical protein
MCEKLKTQKTKKLNKYVKCTFRNIALKQNIRCNKMTKYVEIYFADTY